MSPSDRASETRLQKLLGYLDTDPANLFLLEDAASAAFEEKTFDLYAKLAERRAAAGPLPSKLENLNGLAAMEQQRYGDAAAIFSRLHLKEPADAVFRFNLAWCHAMLHEYSQALALLDDSAMAVSPRAPSLKVQMMHHLGLYQEALTCGEELANHFPANALLMGSLATLALDAERPDLALSYAQRAIGTPEGSTALGMLALASGDVAGSGTLFDEVTKLQPTNARAWVGKGLALLTIGHANEGADVLEHGATLMEDHLGTWIATGWARVVAGDLKKARAAFAHSLKVDPNFSETHGGLAVVDIMEGDIESARRRAEMALRLDRRSIGAALAQSMLLDLDGRSEMAQKIREIALSSPVGPDGLTILQALTRFAKAPRS